ncbi:Dabb family protein [Ralstonia soli]|uniref:Dabb family protein n=1 Tax=Ralstonia soli TaxID=2953896 RepID=A0ABT1ALJ2_9RALS|nr:Dabb family protein [Ralstonia soli]MCO5398997.1 Dabb family protein [Ralstonia soli]
MPLETAQLRLATDAAAQADTAALEQAILSRVRALPGVCHAALGRNLQGCWGAGDYTLDVQYTEAVPGASGLAAALTGLADVDGATYTPIGGGQRAPQLRDGIWRTLMFRVRPEAHEQHVLALEQDTLRMPQYMPGIRNWRLARVNHVNHRDASGAWTHVWQQEFATIDDLLDEYLMHPFHWGRVDRWFDPEFPEWTVDAISHAFCPLHVSLISSQPGTEE